MFCPISDGKRNDTAFRRGIDRGEVRQQKADRLGNVSYLG